VIQIVHERDAKKVGGSAHRDGGISFTSLLEGEEDTPGNFHLMLVHAEDYKAPRHRHNFDQVRIVLDGAFGYENGVVQNAGTFGYFTEGTYYTQNAMGPSTTLLLQTGGASGEGYMSDRQLRAAVAELSTRGTFAEGVYTWIDEAGQKHNKDGYEAAWEHVRGRAIAYPKPRYAQPILWRPEDFAWQPTDFPGAFVRNFGAFTERELRLSAWRLNAGAKFEYTNRMQRVIAYVSGGELSLDKKSITAKSAFIARSKEVIQLEAQSDSEVVVIELMQFD
jgi:hypothetical protein